MKLVVEQGKDSGAEVLVTGSLVAGRDTTCGLVLHDRQASRQHARFEAHGERLKVQDLGSRNGIVINGVLAREGELKVGDRVTVGGTVLRVAAGGVGPWSGKTVGGYRFLDKIGEGGMGEVYRAEQLSMNRFVAAKVLAARLREDPKYIDQLVREARSAAQLNHPGLIQVHDVIQDPEMIFFSMELVQGSTLRELLRKGPLGVPQALSITRQVLEALKYAHAKGIVHHDVKPENVMLGEDGRVKLADLGIAQPAGAKVQENAAGRRTLLGTPQYMPPDQITADKVDPRFDLYALGATCYHILGGKPPYRGASPEEIVRQLAAGPPAPLASLTPGLPADVVAFVEHLMARTPANRTPTAEQALREVAALQAKYGDPDQPAATTTGSATGGLPAPDPASGGWPRRLAGMILGVILLGAMGFGAYELAKRLMKVQKPFYLPPKSTPPPKHTTVPTPPPSNEAVLAALLTEAGKAQADGRLDTAEKAFRDYLAATRSDGPNDDRHLIGRTQAKRGLEGISADRARRREETAWNALVNDPGATDEEQEARLRRFEADYPQGIHQSDAEQRIAQIRDARNNKALAEHLDALSKAADEAQSKARELRGQRRYRTALEGLKAFRARNSDLPKDRAEDLQKQESELDTLRKALWKDSLQRRDDFLAHNQFGEARQTLVALLALEGEGWDAAVQMSLSDLLEKASDYAKEAAKTSAERLAQFDMDGACRLCEEASACLKDTPCAAKVDAQLARARALKEMFQVLIDRISTSHLPCQIAVKLGQARVESANAQILNLRLQDGGGGTTVAWKDLPAPELLTLCRHYLDKRENKTAFWIFCLAWDRGLWKEAQAARKNAKTLLDERPGIEDAFDKEAAEAGGK